MDLEDICRIGAPHGLHPNAGPYVLARAQAEFPHHEPSADLLSQWMAHLKNTGGAYLFSAPVQADAPAPEYATLPPSERLTRWRDDHPQAPTPSSPSAFTPEQVRRLEGLSPMVRLIEARRLALAATTKE
jgi:hypothetical protein